MPRTASSEGEGHLYVLEASSSRCFYCCCCENLGLIRREGEWRHYEIAQAEEEKKPPGINMRSRSGDVDTGKFASWPLLRPDELATLSSDVLKASLAALDLLGGQTSDGEVAKHVVNLPFTTCCRCWRTLCVVHIQVP